MAVCKTTGPHKRDGPWAWLVCFSGASINAVLFGTISGFSVLLPVWCEEFKADRGTTAWIGSLTIGCLFLFSPITINITTRFGERNVGLFAGVFSAAMMVVSSFTHKMVVLFFTHGLCFGICGSILMNISLVSVRKYFKKRVALALGVSGSGGSLGTMVIGPVLQALVDSIGWRNALRVIAVLMFAVSLLTCLFDANIEDLEKSPNENKNLVIERKPKSKFREMMDCSIWRNQKYTIGTLSVWLTFFGLYVPTIHMISFANDRNISSSKSSLLFTFIGVCSTIAQIVFGKVIDKRWLSPLQSVQLSSYILGLSLILFTQAYTYIHFIVLCVLFGIGNGAFVSTQTVFFLTCFGDLKKDAAGYGISHMTKSIPLFTGAPIAGTIADHFASYVPALYIFGGVILLSGSLPFCLLMCRKTNEQKQPEVEENRICLAVSEFETRV